MQVWSNSQGVWVEGRVEEVVGEGGQLQEDGRLPAGSVRVATAKSVMFVPPGRIAEVLRRVSDEAALIAVIGPGAGLNANQAVYHKLDHDARFRMHVLGQRGEKYDRYPEYWDGGSASPNLESFATELLSQGTLEQADCILAGSRGGQVVVPCVWRALGDKVPPAVVINGGCAMTIPGPPVQWPVKAVTIIILGGADYFRGRLSGREYLSASTARVPQGNSSTAILYIREMEHMPQASLMQVILQPLLLAAIYWKASGRAPKHELRNIAQDLDGGKWSGYLTFLVGPGSWEEVSFGRKDSAESPSGKGRAKRLPSQMQSLADQELARTNQLELLVAEKEEELQQLRSQLAESRELGRRLQEAALREDGSNGAAAGGMVASSSPVVVSAAQAACTPLAASGNPAASFFMPPELAFHNGQRVQYWSVSQNIWMDCDIIALRQRDGAVQVNVKPDYWILGEEKAAKIRLPGTAASGSPTPPAEALGKPVIPGFAKASWGSTAGASPVTPSNAKTPGAGYSVPSTVASGRHVIVGSPAPNGVH